MIYVKPEILAQSTMFMAECRPNYKPSGRPCTPPVPGGAAWESELDRMFRRRRADKIESDKEKRNRTKPN